MSAILTAFKQFVIEKTYSSRFTFDESDLKLLDLEIKKGDEVSMLKKASKQVLAETIDKARIKDFKNPDNAGYISTWTNRVSLYVFFKVFQPVLAELGLKTNPFQNYAHAEDVIYQAWSPIINNFASYYCDINRELGRKDVIQECYIAYRNAQLKRAMYLIGSSYKSQCANFSKTLVYAIKKESSIFIPNSTLATRIPVNKKAARKSAARSISYETLIGEQQTD